MKRAPLAFLALVALAIGTAGVKSGPGGQRDPVPLIVDDGTALGGVIEGAPMLTGHYVNPANNQVWSKIDVTAIRPNIVNQSGATQWFINPTGVGSDLVDYLNVAGIWATYGGTDTSRAAVTNYGVQIGAANLLAGKFNFNVPASDSTEGVIGTRSMTAWTDTTEFYFQAVFDVADNKVHWNLGLWHSTPFGVETGTRGSAFATQDAQNKWDGSYNDSVDGVFFHFVAGDTAADGKIDSLKVLCIGNTATDTVWARIDLNPDVAEDASQGGNNLDVAFHVFGFDSIKVVANDSTATMDLSGITMATTDLPIQLRANVMDAETALPFNAMTFTKLWAATRPRR